MKEAMKTKKINIEKKYKALRQQIEEEEKEAFEHLNKEQIRVTSEIDGRILALQNLMKEFEESLTHLKNLSEKNEDILFIEVMQKDFNYNDICVCIKYNWLYLISWFPIFTTFHCEE